MASAALRQVYLIPSFLDENSLQTIPPYVVDGIKECQAFFVENERSARRYFKQLWKEMVIDNYEWHVMDKQADTTQLSGILKRLLQRGMTIGIVSEAGCPGIADPGQVLVETAHQLGATVKPFVGPSSILLALMGSGMNGQCFQFTGYLPIDNAARIKALKDLETESAKKKCTQIFIETPYRNNQLLETITKTCHPNTRLCMAVDITGPNELIQTKTVDDWKKNMPDIHKRPAIFCLLAASYHVKM